ncbi:hypothetical protein ES703_33053 [subsurface metagenome]
MSGFKRLGAVTLSGVSGAGLFYLARCLQRNLRSDLLTSALLEEIIKLAPYLLVPAAARKLFLPSGRASMTDKEQKRPGYDWLLLYPLFSVFGFGIWENIHYFISFPESSIYLRLLYSYPIHLNTGLIYALGFLSGKPALVGLLFIGAVIYHAALNLISLQSAAGIFIYGLGFINLVLFIYLALKLSAELAKRHTLLKGVF